MNGYVLGLILSVVISVLVFLAVTFLCPRSGERVKESYAEKKPVVTLYHSPSCGHCVKFMPVWDKVAETSDVAEFVKVDATTPEGRTKARDAGITGFPTVMRGDQKFKGPRTEENLIAFARG